MRGRGVGETLKNILETEGPIGLFRCSSSGTQAAHARNRHPIILLLHAMQIVEEVRGIHEHALHSWLLQGIRIATRAKGAQTAG